MTLKLNWCKACGGGRNFGDQLAPELLRLYGVDVEWSPPASADVISTGSILSKVPNGWRGTVLGSGYIRHDYRRDLSRANVVNVRGELTAARSGLRNAQRRDVVLGDPAILLSRVVTRDASPTRGAIVVPHTVDKDIQTRYPHAEIVPISLPPWEFIRTVATATLVISSSLHALIVADALGIEHVYRQHPAVTGGIFKFQDYASALGENIYPKTRRLTPRPKMEAAASRLDAAWKAFAAGVKSEAG